MYTKYLVILDDNTETVVAEFISEEYAKDFVDYQQTITNQKFYIICLKPVYIKC